MSIQYRLEWFEDTNT